MEVQLFLPSAEESAADCAEDSAWDDAAEWALADPDYERPPSLAEPAADSAADWSWFPRRIRHRRSGIMNPRHHWRNRPRIERRSRCWMPRRIGHRRSGIVNARDHGQWRPWRQWGVRSGFRKWGSWYRRPGVVGACRQR